MIILSGKGGDFAKAKGGIQSKKNVQTTQEATRGSKWHCYRQLHLEVNKNPWGVAKVIVNKMCG